MLNVRYKKVHEPMVLRLLQEYGSARLSLYNNGQSDDDRQCLLVGGKKLIVVISNNEREVKKTTRSLRKFVAFSIGLPIVHHILRYTHATFMGALFQQSYSDVHRYDESDMESVLSGRYDMQ